MGKLASRKDYLLSEAFEALGKRIYGSEWSGEEYRQEKPPAPEELRKAREPHERELTEIEGRFTALNDKISKMTSPKSMSALVRQKTALEKRRNKINLILHQLPLANEITEAAFRTYERKQTVEHMIVNALRDGSLQAHNGRGEPIHPLVWSGAHGFRYYFELSFALLPRSASPSRRHEHVRITEKSFDNWIETVPPRTPSAEAERSPEEQCRLLLGHIFDKLGPSDTVRKADLKKLAQSEVRGELSGRAFERAWSSDVVPKKFKRPGRRAGTKSSHT